jgi:hypothetical protein
MAMPVHVKPFEKKVFEEMIFLLKYHQKPQVLKRRSIEKKREKVLKKERKKKEKKEKREKRKKRGRKKSSKSLFK